MRNSGLFITSFYCPITRDIPVGGAKIAFLRVWVVDNSATEDVSCSLGSYLETGSQFTSVVKAVAPGYKDSFPVALTFAPLNTHNLGPVVLRCSIPGQMGGFTPSGIVSYTYQEGDAISMPQ